MFYDPATGKLVLNRDNKDYENILEIAQCYLKASDKSRENALEESRSRGIEELEVLNNFLKDRMIQQEIKRIHKHSIPDEYIGILNYLYHKEPESLVQSSSFIYGMMCGKREERARRKGGVCHE